MMSNLYLFNPVSYCFNGTMQHHRPRKGKDKSRGSFGDGVGDEEEAMLTGTTHEENEAHRLLVISEEGFVAAFPLPTSADHIAESNISGSCLLADGKQTTTNRSTAAILQPAQTSLRHLGFFLRFLSKEGLLVK